MRDCKREMAELWPAIFGIGGRAPEERSLRSGNLERIQEGNGECKFFQLPH